MNPFYFSIEIEVKRNSRNTYFFQLGGLSNEIVSQLLPELNYDGPIFDAHTHAVDKGSLDLLVQIGQEYGIERTLLIPHIRRVRNHAEKKYPGRFTFARFFSGSKLSVKGITDMAKQIEKLLDEGYQILKPQNSPVMRKHVKKGPHSIKFGDESCEPIFAALVDNEIPLLLHMSDPNTYYTGKYANRSVYNTKEEDLNELETAVARHSDVRFQLAHFAAQPEIDRLSNLAHWLESYPNFNVDTASARWMVRELSKDPERSREFLIKYQDRVVFGTDCVGIFRFKWRTSSRNYYDHRYLALRLLLETDVRGMPLPFKDKDTTNTGGTLINGLSLPNRVLRKIYWENAVRFYGEA
ncbi:MAG: amidohydrolase family protein [Candidatus Thorarchaeota archaeon]|nr:amidohydrolase family protein [Candidatus Thorarchaeota archaeon]